MDALQNLYSQLQQPSNPSQQFQPFPQRDEWFNPNPQRSNTPPPDQSISQQRSTSSSQFFPQQRSLNPPEYFPQQRSRSPPPAPGFLPPRSMTPPPRFQQTSTFQQPRSSTPPPSSFQRPGFSQQQQRPITPPQYLQQQQFFQQQSFDQLQPFQQNPYYQQWPEQQQYQQQDLTRSRAPVQYDPRPQLKPGGTSKSLTPPRVSQAVVPEPSAIASTSATRHQVHSTLTEPVSVTLSRDVKRVANNLRQIVVFNSNRNDPARTLRDWDLWGPFFFIIALSCILSSTATNNKSTVFAVVFAVLSAGAVSLTMNVVLLGGKLNFLQSLSVLGYCLFPLDVGAILCAAYNSKLYRSIVILVTFLWSSWSVYPFVATAVRPSRKALAVYPVFLMYISMGFLVLAND